MAGFKRHPTIAGYVLQAGRSNYVTEKPRAVRRTFKLQDDKPKDLSPFIANVAFEYALLKQLRMDAGTTSMSWKDAKDIASRGVEAVERLGYAFAGAFMRNEDLTARIERLEAALREIADAYDGYDTWSHTTQRRMLRAVEEARAALGDATEGGKDGP